MYIESLQVSVTFMGDGSVVFGNFHHPEMPSAFQQDQGFQELWDKALSAAGFVNIPRISDVSALYMRIGNTGKVTSHSIDFGAKDCFGNYLVDLWISDLTPFTQRAGSPPKIQESIAVEKCNPAKIRDVNPANKGTPAPEAEVQRTTEATHPAERFSTNPDGTISDSQSGIVWTAEDSGIGLSWIDAQDYCAAKGAGWQLPTVDQLSSIYDESMPLVSCGFVQSTAVSCAVSGRFKLSGPRLWTNKPHEPAQAWYVNLWGGGSGTDHIRPSTVIPALCVRVP